MIYQNNNKKESSEEPKHLLKMIWGKVKPSSQFLDLGCGDGRDALFMAYKGFNVTALDKSAPNIQKLQKTASENNLNNQITFIQKDVRDFSVEKNKYSVINISNLLQFLSKKESLAIINEAKSELKKSGFILISAFSVKDPSYKKNSNKMKCYFSTQELLRLFLDFNILFYVENIITEQGHHGSPHAHKHGIVKIIAQKI